MEKGDIEDMTEEEEQNKKYKNNHYQKKNFNKRPKYPDTKNKPAENFSGKKGKHYNRERDNNNYRHNNNNNNNQPRKNYHKSSRRQTAVMVRLQSTLNLNKKYNEG